EGDVGGVGGGGGAEHDAGLGPAVGALLGGDAGGDGEVVGRGCVSVVEEVAVAPDVAAAALDGEDAGTVGAAAGEADAADVLVRPTGGQTAGGGVDDECDGGVVDEAAAGAGECECVGAGGSAGGSCDGDGGRAGAGDRRGVKGGGRAGGQATGGQRDIAAETVEGGDRGGVTGAIAGGDSLGAGRGGDREVGRGSYDECDGGVVDEAAAGAGECECVGAGGSAGGSCDGDGGRAGAGDRRGVKGGGRAGGQATGGQGDIAAETVEGGDRGGVTGAIAGGDSLGAGRGGDGEVGRGSYHQLGGGIVGETSRRAGDGQVVGAGGSGGSRGDRQRGRAERVDGGGVEDGGRAGRQSGGGERHCAGEAVVVADGHSVIGAATRGDGLRGGRGGDGEVVDGESDGGGIGDAAAGAGDGESVIAGGSCAGGCYVQGGGTGRGDGGRTKDSAGTGWQPADGERDVAGEPVDAADVHRVARGAADRDGLAGGRGGNGEAGRGRKDKIDRRGAGSDAAGSDDGEAVGEAVGAYGGRSAGGESERGDTGAGNGRGAEVRGDTGGQAAGTQSHGAVETAQRIDGHREIRAAAQSDRLEPLRADAEVDTAAGVGIGTDVAGILDPEDHGVVDGCAGLAGTVHVGRDGEVARVGIADRHPAGINEIAGPVGAVGAVDIIGNCIGGDVHHVLQRVGEADERGIGNAIAAARIGAGGAPDVIRGVERVILAAAAGGTIGPIVDWVAAGGAWLQAAEEPAHRGGGDGIVEGDLGGVVAEKLVAFGKPLESIHEHHLAVPGGGVFVQGRPGGAGGGGDTVRGGIDEVRNHVGILHDLHLRDVVRGALKIGDAVAVRVAVGDGGVPERGRLQDEAGAIRDVADDVVVFAAGITGVALARRLGEPDRIDIAIPHHAAVGEVVAQRDDGVGVNDHHVEDRRVVGDFIHEAERFGVHAGVAIGEGVVVGLAIGGWLALHEGFEGTDFGASDGAGEALQDHPGAGGQVKGEEEGDGELQQQTMGLFHGLWLERPRVMKSGRAAGLGHMIGRSHGSICVLVTRIAGSRLQTHGKTIHSPHARGTVAERCNANGTRSRWHAVGRNGIGCLF